VHSREGNARKQTGDAPLHAAERQHPDQPDQAPPQAEIRLAPTAMHANPLTVHRRQFGLDREDKNLNVGRRPSHHPGCGERDGQTVAAGQRGSRDWCKTSA
jgi:hypothetical protein